MPQYTNQLSNFLRWHYPHQVKGKSYAYSQPKGSPVDIYSLVFYYKYFFSSSLLMIFIIKFYIFQKNFVIFARAKSLWLFKSFVKKREIDALRIVKINISFRASHFLFANWIFIYSEIKLFKQTYQVWLDPSIGIKK